MIYCGVIFAFLEQATKPFMPKTEAESQSGGAIYVLQILFGIALFSVGLN